MQAAVTINCALSQPISNTNLDFKREAWRRVPFHALIDVEMCAAPRSRDHFVTAEADM